MIEKNKNGIIIVVLISTFFGLASGLAGSLTIKSYLGAGSTFWGELNFVNDNLERPNILISGAKKVVVAQDERISEVSALVKNSLVGIYEKKATSTDPETIDLNSFYRLGEELGMGLIITSDGWIMADSLKEKDFLANLKNYVVINNKKIYDIESYVLEPKTGFIFFRINARDLPVLNLVNKDNLSSGDTVFGLNLFGSNFISTISSNQNYDDYLNVSSDFHYDKIALANKPDESFNSTFLFNISGEVVLFINNKGELIPSRVFNAPLSSLFRSGEVKRPSLALSYTDMSFFVSSTQDANISGALVRPAQANVVTPWTLAGVRAGDLITHVNDIKLDSENKLNKIVMDASPGDEIELNILRGTEEIEVKVILNELK